MLCVRQSEVAGVVFVVVVGDGSGVVVVVVVVVAVVCVCVSVWVFRQNKDLSHEKLLGCLNIRQHQ